MLTSVEDPICLAKKSLQFLQSNYQELGLEGPTEKCIVIGDTGSGKSTLINFLTKKCGTPTTKANFFVEYSKEQQQANVTQTPQPHYYVVENVQLFEFIEFEKVADFDNYLVKALALNRALARTPRIKILLVVESHAIFIKEDRFTIFCQHLAKILPDYSTIKYSVGLVVTKVDPNTKDKDVFRQVTNLLKRELQQHLQHPSRNGEIKFHVLKQHLNMATLLNCEIYSERYNKNLEDLFKNLLEVETSGTCMKVSTPKFISIFRQPNSFGPVSDLLSADKVQIKEMLMNMDYTQKPVCLDISYPLWESHRDHVSNIITFIKFQLWTLSLILFEHYDLKISNCSNIFELKRALHFESEMFTAMLPEAQDMFNFIISALTDLLEEPTSQAQIFKPFMDENFELFTEVLKFLQGGEKLFYSFEFEKKSGDLEQYFEKWNVFLSYLLSVEKLVATGGNLEEIFDFDYSSGWIVNENNFQNFLEKTIELGVDVTFDTLSSIEDLFLKHLNELLVRKNRIALPDVKQDFRNTIVSKQFLLVLGPAESGKSSLIQSLTGTFPKQIRPENNVPLTVTHNGIQYIECPNWIEATNFLDRLETMLLIEDLLMIMSSFKIIFVLDSSRRDMSDWLLKVIRFLNIFVNYQKAIGFAITKSEPDHCDRFVKILLTGLQSAAMSDSERDFFDQVFTKSRDQYDHVAFSHTNQVDQLIEKLDFISPNVDDLDYTVCLKPEIALMFLIRALDQHYTPVLSQYFDLYDTLEELKEIDAKVKSFIELSTASEWSSMPNFVGSLMALAKIDPEICENYRTLISGYGYSSMLISLRMQFYELAQKRELNIVACGITLSSTMTLVTILVDVDRFLSGYKAQTNKHKFTFSGIDSSNVVEFLNQVSDLANFEQFWFELLNYQDQNLIENLQTIYLRTILSKTTATLNGPEKRLEIRGIYVVCSGIDELDLDRANEIVIFATNKIFIDININSKLKIKKISVIAPSIEIRVKLTGIVNCFFVGQTLSYDQQNLTNWFGPLNFDQVAGSELEEARNFSKFGIHGRLHAYKDYSHETNHAMVRTNKSIRFEEFLSESLKTYTTEEFKELEYLDQLYFLTQSTHPNLFWYKKLHSELLTYEATNEGLDAAKLRICRELQLLTLSKIHSFHDRTLQTKLKTNMEDQCQRIKQKLMQINKLSTDDALLYTKRKLKQRLTASIEIGQKQVARSAKEFGKHSQIIDFQKISDLVPMQVTQHVMNDVVRIINESLKGIEMALNIAVLLAEHGPPTNQTNRMVLDLTIFCNKHIVQFESDNKRRLSGKLKILEAAGIDLTDSETDMAIRQNLQNEMDSIREDIQNLSIPQQECPQTQNARIVQELSKNDKLHLVKKRLLVFGVLESLYAACENDETRIEQVFEVIQPFLEDFKQLLAIKNQVQTVIIDMFEHFIVVYKSLPTFDLDPKVLHLDQVFTKFKNFILTFSKKFDLHKFHFCAFGRIEIAVYNLDETFRHLNNFRTHCQVQRLFRQTVDKNLSEPYNRCAVFLYEINVQIKADLLLKEYNRGVAMFENFVFPFADKCMRPLKAPVYNKNSMHEDNNLTAKLLDTFLDNLRWISRKSKETSSLIPQMLQQRMTQYNFAPQSAHTLFKWCHEEHYGVIFKLLKGEKVFLSADIHHGFATKDVVKFSNLELAFRARDVYKQAIIDTHLKRASIKMRHSGRSYYKLNNKTFVITTDDKQMVYSHDRNATGQASSMNVVARTLKKCEPILSPFTTWKFQVTLNDKKSKLLTLFKERIEIDLLLVGTCCYLNSEFPVEKSAEDFYLSLEDGL